MNINTLSQHTNLFDTEVIKSGFHRDIQDYVNSLSNYQNNVVALKEIADKISKQLILIYGGDLPDALRALLVGDIKPFTDHPHDQDIENLLGDNEMPLPQFHKQLSQILTALNSQIQENQAELQKIKTFIDPYCESHEELLAEQEKAIISVIFKEVKATTNLKELVKSLSSWNRILPLYHQLLTSESPTDIEIVNVQNGSIDFLFNFDFDIAISLTEVFKVGFKSFMAYLAYKKLVKPITESYFGNKKLIDGEKERERELINNIGLALKNEIIKQHNVAIKSDKKIDKNIDKKVDQVTKLVSSHIMKGNDIKLTALPENDNDEIAEDQESKKEELRKVSTEVRQSMKQIPAKEMKALLEKYSSPDEEENGKS